MDSILRKDVQALLDIGRIPFFKRKRRYKKKWMGN